MGIKKGIFSNSAFSAKTLCDRLSRYGIKTDDFEFILSSADYGVAKPDKLVFEAIYRKCGVNKEKIWYAGDSFVNDVAGAVECGLTAVWYNPENEKQITDKLKFQDKIIEIDRWSNFIEVLEGLK